MYVACPSCKSLYPVTADYLRLADGQVRCSHCQTLFDASRAVFEDPREALEYEHPLPQELKGEIDELVDRALDGVGEEAAASPEPSVEVEAAPQAPIEEILPPPQLADGALEQQQQHGGDEPGPRADADWHAWPAAGEFSSSPEVDATDDSGGEDEHHRVVSAPEHLLATPEPVAPRTAWGAIAAALILTAGLLAQYAYYDRYQLAKVASLRPALELLCGSLGCDLPLRRDLSQVEMVERDVRQHPNVDGALLVHASFVNHAQFAQAYPVVQVSFSDISGTPVAVRRLSPQEYLSADAGVEDGMAPGEEALLMVEVVDPGEQAVSFQFDFM